ncbi:MAG: hypothetical protein H5T86_11145, partial [Armatimonadetes bacterium]|nr:hypothetical protein [Armatimonadota bacterium]
EASVSANDHPELRGMFNDFLREVYGGDEQALRATWGEAARFGEVPFKSPPAPTDWADLRWLDLNLFRRRLVERWLRTNVEAMRAVNTRHPITDEYYLLPGGDAGEANRYCDFVNIHCYDIDRPEQLKYYDHAAEGMGFAVGEFSKRSHPSFVSGWGWAPEPEVRRWYMHLVSACLGAGGTLICNWDWKDMESCIFPWGLVYPCDLVPKGQFYVFRALSETLRHVKLTYAPPAVYVLIPDLHVLRGPDDLAGWLPARRCIAALLRIGVPFGVLHDTNIEKLPKEAKLVFYPSPFTLTDATFDWATQFVRRGGTLYVSGDLSYDERGRRTKASRLTELCGVEDGGALYAPRGLPDERLPVTPHIAEIESYSAAPCLTVKPLAASLLASAGDVPALLENSVGQGRVLLSTAPLELFADGPPRQLYEFVLSRAGIEQLRIDGDDGGLTIMLPPQRSGCLAALYREASTPAEVALLGARLRIIPRNWGIVATDETQTPYFLAGQGFVASDGFEVRAERDEPILVASDSPLGKTTSVTLAVVPVQVDPYRAVALQIRWAGASGISVEAGETADGKWRVLCTPKAERVGGNWKIEVPAGLIVRLQKR